MMKRMLRVQAAFAARGSRVSGVERSRELFVVCIVVEAVENVIDDVLVLLGEKRGIVLPAAAAAAAVVAAGKGILSVGVIVGVEWQETRFFIVFLEADWTR